MTESVRSARKFTLPLALPRIGISSEKVERSSAKLGLSSKKVEMSSDRKLIVPLAPSAKVGVSSAVMITMRIKI